MAQKEIIREEKSSVDFVKVESSSEFKQFLRRKRKFIIPMAILFLIFYFMLPIMTSYSTVLNTATIGDVSWVWIFAFAQFVMVWVLSTIYVKKASSFDQEADEIIHRQLN